jgi:putative transposase
MPWECTEPMSERLRFVSLHREKLYSMTELCARFHISRRVGYKWLARFEAGGAAGLEARSRAPLTSPRRTPAALEEALMEAKRAHPHWGPAKIKAYLERQRPGDTFPASSTIGEVFKRHGAVTPRKSRPRTSHPGSKPLEVDAPNQVWATDFKGDFRLGNRSRCYPLTVGDSYSRTLLGCTALPSTNTSGVRSTFEALFAEYGLPQAIRSDNGIPFVASQAPLGLSRLTLWWIKLGIEHQRIQPGKPCQNGRLERLHRTLKAEATRPPEFDLHAQQQRFDRFREEYNHERPHAALGQVPPASCYSSSGRALPLRLPEPEYPGHYEVRRVNAAGCFHFRGKHPFLTEVLEGEDVGLVEEAEGIWSVYFYRQLVARYAERHERTFG